MPAAKPYFPREDIEEMKEHLDRILSSGNLTLSEYTKIFERQFASLVGVHDAIAVNSGTSALDIVLRARGLRRGDEVVVPTNTFAATAAAVVSAGARPVIADVSPDTMTIDSDALERAITRRTRAAIAVHIGGLVCPDIDNMRKICRERNLFLVEDAAHAIGSKIDGRPAGSLGLAGCFSFYATKVVTSGEGGMITTDIEEVARVARILRDQGKESFETNRILRLGYNWRMPEVSAALGILQLRRLTEFIEKRNRIANIYDAGFDGMGIKHITTPPNQLNNYYKYILFLPINADRDKFKALCRERGVLFGGETYWPPLHLQPAFRVFMRKGVKFPVADEWGPRMVNPPIFTQMTAEQANYVLKVTSETLSELMS